jgi:endonuclease/exonuclease/phosphatase family metal-dependent hydrolase
MVVVQCPADYRRRTVPAFSVATFNLHAGVDGWGRPFDVVAACAAIDADVLVLEESWTPDDVPGLAAQVAEGAGYPSLVEHHLSAGRLAAAHPDADHRWMRSFDWRGPSHAIYLDSEIPLSDSIRHSERYRAAKAGRWGIAVLSRLPITSSEVVSLGRLPRDRANRAVIVAQLDLEGRLLTVAGTHMSHITYGAPLQYVRLRQAMAQRVPESQPAVLAGDMNLWGPPVVALLPSWHRALRRPTWPAWRPHSHVDHVLVRGPLRVVAAEVLPNAGSDHLPVRVRLATD